MFGLTVGLAATALLGPLGVGAIRYRVSGLMLSQLKGVDLVSLLLIAPLCVVIGLLAMHGSRAAPVLALGPAVYVLYLFVETIIGPDYLGVAGNNERFFPLFVAMCVMAVVFLVPTTLCHLPLRQQQLANTLRPSFDVPGRPAKAALGGS
jgi:hypothetical protein